MAPVSTEARRGATTRQDGVTAGRHAAFTWWLGAGAALLLVLLGSLRTEAAEADGIHYHTRFYDTYNGGAPGSPKPCPASTSSSLLRVAWNNSPDSVGYGQTIVPDLERSNHSTFPGGAIQSVAYHFEAGFPVTAAQEGPWAFRLGPDIECGAAIWLDGVAVVESSTNMWWGGTWSFPEQLMQFSAGLSRGTHTIEILGFAACCDGAMSFQVKRPADAAFVTFNVTNIGATTFPSGANIATSLTASATTTGPTRPITYSGTFKNQGPESLLNPSLQIGLPAGMIIDSQTFSPPYIPATNEMAPGTSGTFEVVARASGTGPTIDTNFTVTVTGGNAVGGSASTSVKIDRAGPVLFFPLNPTIVQTSSSTGVAVTYPQAIATDDSPPVTITYSKASGTLFPNGQTAVNVTAADSVGNVSGQSFLVVVNRPPVLTIADKTVAEGSTLAFALGADPDAGTNIGGVVGFSATGLPAGATLVGDSFSWTPPYDASGPHPVTFTATDMYGASVSKTITITVTNTNRPPVLSPIGNKSIAEDFTLVFNLSATDADGDPIMYWATVLPAGATLSPGGTFHWMPDYNAAASSPYSVRFNAGDMSAAVSETITITVTNTNRAPVLAAIGDKTIAEASALTFTVSATDPDSDAITYSATGLPAGATLNSATGAFAWTPGYSAAASSPYGVTFAATDPNGRTVSEAIRIAVANTNRAPLLTSIGNKAIAEASALAFTVTATDADGGAIAYTATGLPAGAALNSATGAFAWTPDYTAAASSPYSVTFTATDANSATASETITISVANTNRAPVLTSIGNKSVAEASALAFTVAATDTDGDVIAYTATGLPAGAALNVTTGAFTWTPGYDAAASSPYSVTFTATDANAGTASEQITITVTNTNRLPVLAAIGNKSVAEGSTLMFPVIATDADGSVTYSASGLPAGATLDNTTGVFLWTPGFTAAAASPYTVTFTATDAEGATASASITITVGGTNRSPVIAAVGDKSVAEGSALTFTVSATDPDGDTVAYSASDLPTGATLNSTTGAFSWTPAYTAAVSSPYSMTIFATDANGAAASEAIRITVTNTQSTPVLAAIGNKTIAEGATLAFTVSAIDVDGDVLTYSATGLPAGATLNSATGAFSWTAGYGAAASSPYAVTITATDTNGATDSEAISIVVTNTNRPPVLSAIGDRAIAEGSPLTFTVSATDPDGGAVTYSSTVPIAAPVPVGATLDATTGAFSWTPGATASTLGPYTITFMATDAAGSTASESITIMVTNTNWPPVLSSIGSKNIAEAAALAFSVSATDADGDAITYSATGLPAGAALNSTTGAFVWTPDYAGAASSPYSVRFTATDANGATASETIAITVANTNRAPLLALIGNKSIAEVSALTFTVSATDPDADTITYSATGMPAGATLNSANGAFAWTPDYNAAASSPYTVTFTATDANAGTASESITISVTNTNRAPVLTAIGNKTIAEAAALTFTVNASDADGDAIAYSATGMPPGAGLNSATGAYSWTPSYDAAASSPYSVTFTATDANGATASEPITITVANTNRLPVLAAIGNKIVAEGSTLMFTVNAADADGAVTYSATGGPAGATLGGVTGVFLWTPGFGAAVSSPYTVTITAADAEGATDSESITITVGGTNRSPVLAAVGDKSVAEGSALTFTVSANDPDGDMVTYSATDLPIGATLNGTTGVFSWTPAYTAAGSSPYSVRIFAADAKGAAASETMSITVTNTQLTPVLVPIGDKTIAEGATLTFTATAMDVDGDLLTYSATGMPAGATLNSVTGAFSWTPAYGAAASSPYAVTITATDTNGATDSEAIIIAVTNTNRPPVLTPIGNRTIAELATLTFTVSAMDPDGGAVTYSSSIPISSPVPAGATFNVTTGVFSWTPSATASALSPYTVTFTATDAAGSKASESITLTVTKTNRTPVLVAVGNKTVVEGTALTFMLTATDPDADPITYSATGLPAGATLNSVTGAFAWTPGSNASASSPYAVTFTAADSNGAKSSESISITVTKTSHAPVLTSIGDKSVAEASTLSFTVSAIDSDNHAITYGATGLPAGATLGSTSGAFSWTPGYDAFAGSPYRVVFTATDSTGATASESISVAVTNTNRAPVLAAIGNRTVRRGSPLLFGISATDADGEALTYHASALPSGASLDSGKGTFSWTPGETQAGEYTITFSVTDGFDTASETIVITVTVAPPTTVTLISSKNPAMAGESVSFTASVTAGATGSITFRDGSAPLGTAALNEGTASMTTRALAIGAHAITAAYAGDSAHAPSVSPSLSQMITPVPTLKDISPSSGPVAGDQLVTITGTSLTTVMSVTFGDTAAVIVDRDDSSIVVRTPPHKKGVVDVIVLAAATLRTAYRYEAPQVLTLPVVGSTAGEFGAFYRTALQIYNSGTALVAGTLTFRPQGLGAGAGAGAAALQQNPSAPFSVEPGETLSIADVVAKIGGSGIGSLDIAATDLGSLLIPSRVYNDAGREGTTGFGFEPSEGNELQAGDRAVLITPADVESYRYNVGVRALTEGSTIEVQLLSSSGDIKSTVRRTYGANRSEQVAGSLFTGTTLAPNDTIIVNVERGSLIVYGSMTDNRTQDPTYQEATSVVRQRRFMSETRLTVPVAGSTAGGFGSFFKTAMQFHNEGNVPITGRLIFRPQGGSAGGEDFMLPFSIESRSTQAIEDVIASMKTHGVGSLDIFASDFADLFMTVRVYNDSGKGTTGAGIGLVDSESTLRAGERGVLITPADPDHFRLNIGVRTLGQPASILVTLTSADGTVKQTTAREYGAERFEQVAAALFAGAAIEANDAIVVSVNSGSLIVYGSMIDNRTQDSTYSLMRRR